MQLINIHRKHTENIGDLFSSPLNYYDFGDEVSSLDIWNDIDTHDFENTNVIVGGGGLLSHSGFLPSIEKIIKFKKEGIINKLIFWGVGKNAHFDRTICKKLGKNYQRNLVYADLVGIRDLDTNLKYVPCPSCKLIADSNFFDKNPKDKVVYYEHSDFELPKPIPGECLGNSEKDINKVLEFLSSSRVVITNIYHGVYWSLLLGKKVFCVPFSTKFDNFKFLNDYYILDKNTTKEEILEDHKPSKKFLNHILLVNNNFYDEIKKLLF